MYSLVFLVFASEFSYWTGSITVLLSVPFTVMVTGTVVPDGIPSGTLNVVSETPEYPGAAPTKDGAGV